MANFYKNVDSAPIKYVDSNGEIKKKKVQAIRKDVKIPNSFKKKYNRGIAGAFNYALSTSMFYAIYDKNGQKRPFPMAQDWIYLSGQNISKAVGLKDTQPYNILRSLERILDVHIVRANEKAGANKFRLSERAIEFMNIYTESKLQAFISKYQIDKHDIYALRQLYKYRVIRLSDGNMDREEKQEYSTFIKSKDHRNYIHDISRNNESDQARVNMIEMHIEFLSERQIEQLNKIKQELKNGVKRLVKRLHMNLVKLQQFITISLKRKNSFKDKETPKQDKPSLTNSESNKKETAEHASATRAAQRIPEEPTPGDIMEVCATWNNVVRGQEKIPHIAKMDQKTYNAICKQVKSYGKETIISSIKKVTGLTSVSGGTFKMDIHSFMTTKTLDLIPTLNIKEDIQSDWLDDYLAESEIIAHMDLESIPEFTSSEDAMKWFNKEILS